VVARQRVELAVRQAGAAAVLRALLVGGAGRAEPPSQGPEDHEDVDKQHHRDAGDEEDCRENVAGARGGHAIFYSRLRGEAASPLVRLVSSMSPWIMEQMMCFCSFRLYALDMERMLCSSSFRLSALDIERYQDVVLSVLGETKKVTTA
jgi:hypothetical protein